MWVLGFTMSVTRLALLSGFLIDDWNDFNIKLSFCLLSIVFESSLGILYWLFGLEFYSSALAIEAILSNSENTQRVFTRTNKKKIFLLVSLTFICIEIGCCVGQLEINKGSSGNKDLTETDVVPALAMVIFSAGSLLLLIFAIFKVRKISQNLSGLEFTRKTQAFYLLFFTMGIIFSLCWIPVELNCLGSDPSSNCQNTSAVLHLLSTTC